MKFLFSLSILLLVASCSDVHKPKQLEKIASIERSLDSLNKVILANPLDSATEYDRVSREVELRIKNHYYADTINLELGKKMNAYKVMRRKWSPLSLDFANLLNGVKETNESLRQLKHDIENGDGDRSKYDDYIAFEKNKTEQLIALGNEYVESRASTFKTFRHLHEELNAFSQLLVKQAEAKRQ